MSANPIPSASELYPPFSAQYYSDVLESPPFQQRARQFLQKRNCTEETQNAALPIWEKIAASFQIISIEGVYPFRKVLQTGDSIFLNAEIRTVSDDELAAKERSWDSDLEGAIISDAEDCTKVFCRTWKVNVMDLKTDTISRTVSLLKGRGFLVRLDDRIGVVSINLDQATCSINISQELIISCPVEDSTASEEKEIPENALFSPQSVKNKRMLAEKSPHLRRPVFSASVDQKLGHIFVAISFISVIAPSIRRWKFNTRDLTYAAAAKVVSDLSQLGYRVLTNDNPYKISIL
jgi:hypothetical protein